VKSVLREKHRYIAFELISEEKFQIDQSTSKEFERSLQYEIFQRLGELGYSKVMPKLIFFGEKGTSLIGIIRTTTAGISELRSALPFITQLEGKAVHLRSLCTSGTIAALRRKLKI